jgi:hypothetical protein
MCHEAIQSLYVPLKTIPNNLTHFFADLKKACPGDKYQKKLF